MYPDSDYFLGIELNQCPECDGMGSIEGDLYEHTCTYCDGSGIDPNAVYEEENS